MRTWMLSGRVGVLVSVLAWSAVACGGTQSQAADDNPTTPVVVDDSTPATDTPATDTPTTAQPVEEAHAPAGGRMAFTTCDAGDRPQMCTKEYRPVCGEVDNGVRCITTPCNSTEQRNFGNACMACADAKTNGYWPVACEALGNDAR